MNVPGGEGMKKNSAPHPNITPQRERERERDRETERERETERD